MIIDSDNVLLLQVSKFATKDAVIMMLTNIVTGA